MGYHITGFFLGFLLDLWLGDPYWLPHPIRLMGSLITGLEKRMNGKNHPLGMGAGMVVLVLLLTGMITAAILLGAYQVSPWLGLVVESMMTYQILATKSLKLESMKVYEQLKKGDLPEARRAVSMIVGRDTQVLDETGVAKAAIETVAENTSDGVIAPMLYLAIGGPILGFLYKAINTMDSMVGYKNQQYLLFGRAAAKLDDMVNYIPARVSGYLMILACFFSGEELDGKKAYRIYKRDRRNHASPNSAQTEAAGAGALGIQLAGDASYFGKVVKKQTIGDSTRPVTYEDIGRINHLLYRTAWLCQGLCLVGLGLLWLLVIKA